MADLCERLVAALERPGQQSSDFDLNPETVLPEGRKLRAAGVLVASELCAPRPVLFLAERASGLKHHPGQIAFPGGKQDDTDVDVVGAALREAEEEIGLGRDLPRILGQLPAHETVTGFSVTPVLAVIEKPFEPIPELGEVEEVFEVPLSHVLNAENYLIESRLWRGARRYYFTVPYGPYYIWGATARMLRALAARIEDDQG